MTAVAIKGFSTVQAIAKWFKNLFSAKDPIETYLSQATDHVDLENRMKQLKYKGIWV